MRLTVLATMPRLKNRTKTGIVETLFVLIVHRLRLRAEVKTRAYRTSRHAIHKRMLEVPVRLNPRSRSRAPVLERA